MSDPTGLPFIHGFDARQIWLTNEFVTPDINQVGDSLFNRLPRHDENVLFWEKSVGVAFDQGYEFERPSSYYRAVSYWHDDYRQLLASGFTKQEAGLAIAWREPIRAGYEDLGPKGQYLRPFNVTLSYPLSTVSGIPAEGQPPIHTNFPVVFDSGNIEGNRSLNMGNRFDPNQQKLSYLDPYFRNHRGLDVVPESIIHSVVSSGRQYLDAMWASPRANEYHPSFPSCHNDNGLAFWQIASGERLVDNAFSYETDAEPSGSEVHPTWHLVHNTVEVNDSLDFGRFLNALPLLSGVNAGSCQIPAMDKTSFLRLTNVTAGQSGWIGENQEVDSNLSVDYLVQHNSNLAFAQNVWTLGQTEPVQYQGNWATSFEPHRFVDFNAPATDFLAGCIRLGMTQASGIDIAFDFSATPKEATIDLTSASGDRTIKLGTYFPRYSLRVYRDGVRRDLQRSHSTTQIFDSLPETIAEYNITSQNNSAIPSAGFLPASGVVRIPASSAFVRRPEVRSWYEGDERYYSPPSGISLGNGRISDGLISYPLQNWQGGNNSDCQLMVLIKSDWAFHRSLMQVDSIGTHESGTIYVEPLTIDSASLSIAGIHIPLTSSTGVKTVSPADFQHYAENWERHRIIPRPEQRLQL